MKKITELSLSDKTINILISEGIDTESKLIEAFNDHSIFSVKKIGRKTLEEILANVKINI